MMKHEIGNCSFLFHAEVMKRQTRKWKPRFPFYAELIITKNSDAC